MYRLRLPLRPLLVLGLSAHGLAAQAPLTGAGASFVDPVATQWFAAFTAMTSIPVHYEPRGPGAGVRTLLSGEADFSLSDRPWSRSLLAGARPGTRQFPVALGATVITYNLPTIGARPLRLDGALLAEMLLGRIARWNDPRITRLNPSLRLPDTAIRPVYRSDGSAATRVLTTYLSRSSTVWREELGAATSVAWPIGSGGRGNEGVAWQVAQEVGSVGYVDLSFALTHGLPMAELRNQSGRYVPPGLHSLQAAVPDPLAVPDSDPDEPGPIDRGNPDAYPCTSLAWIAIRPEAGDSIRAGRVDQFARWLKAESSWRAIEFLLYPAGGARGVG
jgi:phosphate transport system substrate-binding protein